MASVVRLDSWHGGFAGAPQGSQTQVRRQPWTRQAARREKIDLELKCSNNTSSTTSWLPTHIKLEKLLGAGAFATVFKGFDTRIGVACAVKVSKDRIRSGETIEQYWLRLVETADSMDSEIAIHRNLDHKHIVKVFEGGYFEDGEHRAMITELMDGDLHSLAEKRPSVPERTLFKAFRQVLSAVAYLHEGDLVHQDIKPENLLFRRESKGYVVKLADFGLCIDKSAAGGAGGTPCFEAPEVWNNGEHHTASDIHSLFVTFMGAMLNCGGIRGALDGEYNVLQDRIQHTAHNDPRCVAWSDMVDPDPTKRPTAQALLARATSVGGFDGRALKKKRTWEKKGGKAKETSKRKIHLRLRAGR